MNIGTIDIRCVNEVAIFGGTVVPLGLRPLPPAWARPAPHPSARYVDPDCLYGTRSSRSGRITTLLLVRVAPRPDEYGRPLTPVDRHMRHARRHVQVVASARGLAMLQLITGPQLDFVTAQHVERRFVVLVDVSLNASANVATISNASPNILASARRWIG